MSFMMIDKFYENMLTPIIYRSSDNLKNGVIIFFKFIFEKLNKKYYLYGKFELNLEKEFCKLFFFVSIFINKSLKIEHIFSYKTESRYF